MSPHACADADACRLDEACPHVSGCRMDEQALVSKPDLLHCLQVAVWRGGLLEEGALRRLKAELGIGENEPVPKPSWRL